jgi:predicted ArsR family transcriptional regulator
MSADSNTKVQKMDPDDVCSFVREHEDPLVTVREVAEQFDVTPKAARYRLKQLEERGRVRSKKISANATAWFPVG